MTESEFLERSAALCKRLGKWPEWVAGSGGRKAALKYGKPEDFDDGAPGKSFAAEIWPRKTDDWYRVKYHADSKAGHSFWFIPDSPRVDEGTAVAHMERFWRVWLDERAVGVYHGAVSRTYYWNIGSELRDDFTDHNAAQIAAVEAVLAEEEGDGTA